MALLGIKVQGRKAQTNLDIARKKQDAVACFVNNLEITLNNVSCLGNYSNKVSCEFDKFRAGFRQ